MKLTQLFSGEARADAPVRGSQPTPAQAEQMSRQIRSLVPGQTISGEIIARNGNEVQIRLSEDMVLNARVDRNMNIEIGKNMTFEVKNNGSALTLSPLFTNVATDVNVMKALDMAGLPLNRTTVDMTEQLMAAGLPVNKGSLQQIFREINSFPQATVEDIINLHKLQMPVNEGNVNQMASYRNLSYQLVDGMNDILGTLPEVFDSMMAEGDVLGAVRLYQEVLSLAGEMGSAREPGIAQETDAAQGMGAGGTQTAGETGQPLQTGAGAEIILDMAAEVAEGMRGETQIKPGSAGAQAGMPEGAAMDAVQGNLRAAVAEEAMGLIDYLRLPPEEAAEELLPLPPQPASEAVSSAAQSSVLRTFFIMLNFLPHQV